jgi:3-oxoacyl-[acyl-carrier protein] reductase
LLGRFGFLLSPRSAFVTGQALAVSTSAANPHGAQPLAGKTALVTGAARGIGEATARRLAEEGARVIVLDIPPEAEALTALAEELDGVSLPLDITDPAAAADIAAAASGRLDVLVHNAGITRDKTLAKMDEQRWDLTIDVNLTSVIAVTETLIEKGAISEGGRIVLVSSIAGIAGNAGQTNYAASKSGVAGLTRYLGGQLAERDIAVNAVAPGFIETRLTHAIPFTIREVGRRFSNLNQGGLPVDVAEAITFLSSPGAGGLHGNVLRVCGGNLLGA